MRQAFLFKTEWKGSGFLGDLERCQQQSKIMTCATAKCGPEWRGNGISSLRVYFAQWAAYITSQLLTWNDTLQLSSCDRHSLLSHHISLTSLLHPITQEKSSAESCVHKTRIAALLHLTPYSHSCMSHASWSLQSVCSPPMVATILCHLCPKRSVCDNEGKFAASRTRLLSRESSTSRRFTTSTRGVECSFSITTSYYCKVRNAIKWDKIRLAACVNFIL